MSSRVRRLFLVASATLALAPLPAWAQFTGPGAQPGGAPPPTSKEAPAAAEAAPETTPESPALQPLPAWPGQQEKTLQFFELHGYMRGRAYLFHQLNLGVTPSTSGVTPPFYVPYSEAPTSSGQNPASCSSRNNNNGCKSDNITSADMRLRLEPVVNISDYVRVKAQIDVFDNMVMGSTPEGYYINGLSSPPNVPLSAFAKSQESPETNRNSLSSSIRVKRAWAEVRTPIGELRFGRMPSQWGTGMFVNDGNCLDCDYGTNADRVMFATKLFDHFLVLGYDWVATGPTTALINPNFQGGQAFNADPIDDVSQVILAVGRQDKPEELAEKVQRGAKVVNYGGYFVYRWQKWAETTNPGQGTPTGALLGQSPRQLGENLSPRHAWAFIPDLWFRFNWKALSIEAEGVMLIGDIGDVKDVYSLAPKGLSIRQFGALGRANYAFLHNTLHIGLEVGFASGDDTEDSNGNINFQTSKPVYTSHVHNFTFSPDYHVDLILFRRILGTVTNATYLKPSVSYDILDSLSARLDLIYSLANVAVSYPGNSNNLGLELDGSVLYHNDRQGFYAGLAYGVLFPFAALNFPSDIYGAPGFSAKIAQTFQGRLIVKF